MVVDYISPERRAAARAVLAGAAPSQRRVATMMAISPITLKSMIDDEGWTVLDFRRVPVRECYGRLQDMSDGFEDALGDQPGELSGEDRLAGAAAVPLPAGAAPEQALSPGEPLSPRDRAARLRGLLLDQSDRIVRRMEQSDDITSRRNIDALGAIAKLADRLGEIASEAQVQQQEESDEDIAEVLARIHERILTLAKGLANEMVEKAGVAGAEAGRG